jgi:hypothetical protein
VPLTCARWSGTGIRPRDGNARRNASDLIGVVLHVNKYREIILTARVRVDETEDFGDQAIAYEVVGSALLQLAARRRAGDTRGHMGIEYPLTQLEIRSEPCE